MLKILMELGLTEEIAKKVMEAVDNFLAENPAKDDEKEQKEEKKEGIKEEVDVLNNEKAEEKKEKGKIPPVGKADDNIPSKEEFEKMGYLARVEFAKKNPEVYERLKNEK